MTLRHSLTMTPSDAAAALHKVPSKLGQATNTAIKDFSLKAARLARENAKKGRPFLYRRTGFLLQRIRATWSSKPGDVRGGISFPDIPGRVLNDGAVIVPRRGKYLVFRLYASPTEATPTGPWVRTKRVVIPKTLWATKAIQEASRDVPSMLNQKITAAWREALRG